jgi:uncharacterized membrane protein
MTYALLLASGTAVCWGIDAFLNKTILDLYAADVWLVMAVKLVVISALGAFMLPFMWTKMVGMKHRTVVLTLTALSGLALAAGELFLLMAFERSYAPTIITAIGYCSPVVATILFVLVLKEKLSALTAVGFVVMVAGMLILAFSHTPRCNR